MLPMLRRFIVHSPYTQVTQRHCHATNVEKTLTDESVYTDDADFVKESTTQRDRLTSAVADTFPAYNLIVNDTKTDHTVLERVDRNNELWRSTKTKRTFYNARN